MTIALINLRKKNGCTTGTQKEGRAIASLLNTHFVEEEDANKEFVKSLVSPKILHIATHAFYNAEAGDSKNNSGMVFTVQISFLLRSLL